MRVKRDIILPALAISTLAMLAMLALLGGHATVLSLCDLADVGR
jgi:hypothetical protein